jgi:nucleotide-binding universal stress UspA family protein
MKTADHEQRLHGRSGLKHALIGSVAEQVARYAECPVMIMPSEERLI